MFLTPSDPKKSPAPSPHPPKNTHSHTKKIIRQEVCPIRQSLLMMNFLGELFNLQQQAPTCKWQTKWIIVHKKYV
jgi:hypothetical protein